MMTDKRRGAQRRGDPAAAAADQVISSSMHALTKPESPLLSGSHDKRYSTRHRVAS